MNFVVTYREKDGSRSKIAIEADDRAGVFPILRERGISAIRVEEGKLSAKDGRSKWPTSKGLKLLLAGCALLSLVAVALTIGFSHPNDVKVSKTTTEEPKLSQPSEKTSPVCEKPKSECPSGWVAGPDADWKVFWNDALVEAKASGKKIFVLSTGSDWCGWCKKLKQDVFEKDEFKSYAKKKLVLLCLDSPRKPLPTDQKQHNDTICGTLSFGGGVPCAAVFGVDSRRYGVISGYSKTPAEYIARIDEVLAKKGEMPKSGQPPKIFTEGYIPSSNAVQSVKEAMSNPQGEESKANRQATAVPNRGRSLGYKSETVDGMTWQYYISNGVAVVEAPARIVGPARAKVRLSAIPDSTDGTVIVPDSLGGCPIVRIGESALEYCKNVTKVIMPSSVTSIGAEAFDGCKSLSEVVLPDAVLSIEQGAFSYCTNLVSVTVPAGLMHIGKGAFQGCRRLAGFTIPTNCVSIGARAFEGCDALGEMKIPAGVRRIGDGGFSGLQSFVVDEQNPTFWHIGGGLYNKDGTRMFGYPCTGGVARISAAVTNISESACKELGRAKSIEVDPANRFYKSSGGCLYDKSGTILFRCPHSMPQLAIPNGVKRIGPHAFEANAELVEVSFPTSVVEIGECAFYACRGLTSVSLPANVTNISGCAFSYCTSLESVTIPSSVKHVGNHAFNRCKNLKSVVLKPGVESVGNQAFISCPKLSVVYLPSSVRRFGRMGAYRTFDVWGQYTLGPNAPRRTKEDGALTFVVEKGDEERVRNLLYDRSYERQCRAARDRGLLYPEIRIVTEEEWRGGKSPDKADKKK